MQQPVRLSGVRTAVRQAVYRVSASLVNYCTLGAACASLHVYVCVRNTEILCVFVFVHVCMFCMCVLVYVRVFVYACIFYDLCTHGEGVLSYSFFLSEIS